MGKLKIYPPFTIDEMYKALSPLASTTHRRNISYSLQFLAYAEDLLENHLSVRYSIDSLFAKTMTIVAASVIECILFDILQQKNAKMEKWKDIKDPTELPVYPQNPNKRVRVVYQEKKEQPIDKFIFFSHTLDLCEKHGIINSSLKEELNRIKEMRDLVHLRGGKELDIKKINLKFYQDTTKPILIKIMKIAKLQEAIRLLKEV